MNKKLPFLISVSHGGLKVPQEVAKYSLLTLDEIIADGDVGSMEIYAPLKSNVDQFVLTDIARAFVDVNRAPNDLRKDGVVKTHTCWDVPIYSSPLTHEQINSLLERYYYPYHETLTQLSKSGVILGIDCHTMAAVGPPVGPDTGQERPNACLGNADGTCPDSWIETLRVFLAKRLPGEVTINRPFSGGYITRNHANEMPWLQLELSRGDFASCVEKSNWIFEALRDTYNSIKNS